MLFGNLWADGPQAAQGYSRGFGLSIYQNNIDGGSGEASKGEHFGSNSSLFDYGPAITKKVVYSVLLGLSHFA